MTKSRGIYKRHGFSKSSIYHIWCGMRSRCLVPSNAAYANYGGRGITVCERWLDFENFLSDMGEKPEGLSLDRIDNNKGYSPENCRWATRTQQAQNKRGVNPITIDGETRFLPDWCEVYSIAYKTVHMRISKGWSVESAIKTPLVTERLGIAHSQPIHNAKQPLVTFCGEEITFAEAVKRSSISADTIHQRLKRGWPTELAFTAPALRGQRIAVRFGAEHGVKFADEEERAA